MKSTRRNWLQMVAALVATPAIPAVSAPVPKTVEAVNGRGETASIVYYDDAPYQGGKSGQLLTQGENGPEWRDPPTFEYTVKLHPDEVKFWEGYFKHIAEMK